MRPAAQTEGNGTMTNDENENSPVRIPAPGAGQDLPGAVTAEGGSPRGKGRRRVLVPAAIAVVAVAGVAAVPALAASQDLPSITAQQLLAKVLASKAQTFSGSVQATVDLGIPSQIAAAIPSAVAGSGGSTGQASQAQLAEKELVALVSGGTHTFQVAADGRDRQRVSSSDSGTAFTLVHNGSSAWAYDAQSKSATHVTGLQAGAAATQDRGLTDPQQAATQALAALGSSTTVSVAGTAKVADQSVYKLSVKPKGTGSTIGEVLISVDAANGLPLQVQVNPADGSDPILKIWFSTVSFATPAASTFDFTPPSGTKVVQQQSSGGTAAAGHGTVTEKGGAKDSKVVTANGGTNDHNVNTIGTGWSTIYRFDAATSSAAASGKSGTAGQLSAIKTFGKQVPGGTLISTKLINVLVTDKGTVYAGAVTPALLEQAAK
ncbi:outer membrane lipoprotein-sorting protein [Streptacidiphilus sp. EB103A]